jgi:hypothetical protein
MASLWNEYLCLKRSGATSFQLFIGQYEGLAELNDYYDEDLEDYVLPTEIDGKQVAGTEDDMVVGGDLVCQDESEAIEFSIIFDPRVKDWLDKTGWSRLGVLPKIETAIASLAN